MNLVKLDLYGCGYCSGQEYREVIFLLEDDYKSLNEDLNGIKVSLGELDGKHSEVYGKVEVEIVTEEQQQNYNFEYDCDGDDLYYKIEGEYTSEIKEMIKRANKYIASLDSLVTIEFTVKKSKVTEIRKAVNELNK
jgi:hypothetical protein